MRLSFEKAEERLNKTLEHFSKELNTLRIGRASSDLVEGIMVEAYDQKMPINQLVNINVVDATLITIQPWDKSILDTISKAIQSSGLGITPQMDGDLIRLPMPPLTEDRRKEFVKLVKQMTEDARIAVRQIRKDILIGIDNQKEDNQLTEDEMKRKKKELTGISRESE